MVAAAIFVAALLLGECGAGSNSNADKSSPSTHSVVTAAVSATTATAKSLAAVDFRNYGYEDRVCGTKKAVRFTNGTWRQEPASPINFCGMSISAVALADVTGDGAPDAIVTGVGDLGGGTAVSQVTNRSTHHRLVCRFLRMRNKWHTSEV
jgi:hypothetical protein